VALNVIYRLCELETSADGLREGRPPWFSKAAALSNFLDCLDNSKEDLGEIVFVHDGPKGELYERLTNRKIDKIETLSNSGSLARVYDLASEIRGTTYFVEDDYLHFPDAIPKILAGATRFGLVTGYDHPDRYLRNDDICLGKETIAWDQSTMSHWRTVESTTCTFAAREDVLELILPILKAYLVYDRALFRKLYEAGLRLWSPLPGISTHLMQEFLGFGVDWKSVQNRQP
jgi:hypothetical protein